MAGAGDAGMRQVRAFEWQQQQHPVEPAERDIAVDPFSLRQFSRLDMDRPLPIPSVSVADPHVSPARFGAAGSASFPRVSIAGRLNALAEATGGWDDTRLASPPAQQETTCDVPVVPRSGRKTSAGGETTELADGGFDVVLLSSSVRKASEPQRWGSDVPLMAAAAAEEEEGDSAGCYSFPNTRGKNGRGKARYPAGQAPFSCCMYVPGLSSRRAKPPAPARSSSSGAFGHAAAAAEKQYRYTDDPGTARQSTVSMAVSLERFDCGSLSTSSWGDLELDGEVSSSSCFDLLPLELVLGGEDDETDLPVCSAFVFDRDVIRKSVLKKRLADNGAGEAPPRPSLGRVSSADVSGGRTSAAHVRVSLKSRAPPAPASP